MYGEYLGVEGVRMQSQRNDCGPASLMMVLEAHRIQVPYQEIKRRIPLTPQGSSLYDLRNAARTFGLQSEGWKLSFDDLKSKPKPLIIFLKRHHFAVLDRFEGPDIVRLRDPSVGSLRSRRSDLERVWDGPALLFWECRHPESCVGISAPNNPARWVEP